MSFSPPCPICQTLGTPLYKELFFACPTCKALFRPEGDFPTPEKEKARYEEHINNSEDLGYQQFVQPIVQAVLGDFSPHHSGLDFGSGKDSAISKLLKEKGYEIAQYDPFFFASPEALNRKYDYIVCCEVMEHFYDPLKEFRLLQGLLQPQGKLYCMTHLYEESIDFGRWYYKNDSTHVCIYQKETVEYVAKTLGFSSLEITGRLIVLS